MNTYQTNSMAMYKQVAKHLDDHNDVWSEMSPLTVSLQAFKGKILDAENAVLEQETPTGATDAKAAARVVVDRAATHKATKTAGTAPPNPHP